MKRKIKYLCTIIFLLTFLLIGTIKLHNPLRISTEISLFHQIPIFYWINILIISFLVTLVAYYTSSTEVYLYISVVYIFIIYSYYLFFIIPSYQTDLGFLGNTFSTLEGITNISPDILSYANWPIFHVFFMSFQNILNISYYSIMFYGFYSFLIMIPLFLYLVFKGYSNKSNFFIAFSSFIILVSFFINDQLAPQFIGYLFLILTVGCFLKYQEENSKKIYFFILLFYTLSVFSHPFIFVFFPLGIFIDKFVRKSGYFFYMKRHISMIPLLIIYLIGLLYRFSHMTKWFYDLIFVPEGEGRSWYIIDFILDNGNGVAFETNPLYNLISPRLYEISNDVTFYLLVIFALILLYSIYVFRKQVKSFDLSCSLGGGGWFIFGFVNPSVIGGRGFQVIFLTIPKYITKLRKSRKKLFVIVMIIIIVFPFIYTTNRAVNQSVRGGYPVEDSATLSTGEFAESHLSSEMNISSSGRSYYPTYRHYSFERIARGEINESEIEVLLYSPKTENRISYYQLDFEEFEEDKTNKIYDQGEGYILVRDY